MSTFSQKKFEYLKEHFREKELIVVDIKGEMLNNVKDNDIIVIKSIEGDNSE
jgi:hypothetical protein